MDLVAKDFKSAILNRLKNLRDAVFKELKESVRMMSHHIVIISKQNRKVKNQMQILELKGTITKI